MVIRNCVTDVGKLPQLVQKSGLSRQVLAHQRQLSDDLFQLGSQSNWDAELSLVYQPQIDLLADRVFGFEALLRWHPVQQRVVMPGEFMPLAAQAGLMGPLTAWVFRQVGREMARWKRSGRTPNAEPRISVNIAPQMLLDVHLQTQIQTLLDRQQLNSENIILELTSTDLLFGHDVAVAGLQALCDRGFRISVTLTRQNYQYIMQTAVLIETLPIDMLKFDRGFIAMLDQDLTAEAAFFGIVNLAKRLQIQLSAEGIERPEQIEFLSWHGCHVLQGHWYSLPMAADAVPAWLGAFGDVRIA